VVLSLYFDTADDATAAWQQISAAIDQWAPLLGAPVQISPPRSVKREEWSESWKIHFQPVQVSPRITVCPSWDCAQADTEHTVIIDPGMSFGTGHHESTRACLEFVDSLAGPGVSFLEVGCGSGILSIAAAKLGCQPIAAFDLDPVAAEAAAENAMRNGVSERIAVQCCEVAAYERPAPFSLVAANLLAHILVDHAPAVCNCAAANGALLLAGILTAQRDDVLAAYATHGWHLAADRVDGDWYAVLLRRSDQPALSV
jgi:ribosomal protein L11 methyltransferase